MRKYVSNNMINLCAIAVLACVSQGFALHVVYLYTLSYVFYIARPKFIAQTEMLDIISPQAKLLLVAFCAMIYAYVAIFFFGYGPVMAFYGQLSQWVLAFSALISLCCSDKDQEQYGLLRMFGPFILTMIATLYPVIHVASPALTNPRSAQVIGYILNVARVMTLLVPEYRHKLGSLAVDGGPEHLKAD